MLIASVSGPSSSQSSFAGQVLQIKIFIRNFFFSRLVCKNMKMKQNEISSHEKAGKGN